MKNSENKCFFASRKETPPGPDFSVSYERVGTVPGHFVFHHDSTSYLFNQELVQSITRPCLEGQNIRKNIIIYKYTIAELEKKNAACVFKKKQVTNPGMGTNQTHWLQGGYVTLRFPPFTVSCDGCSHPARSSPLGFQTQLPTSYSPFLLPRAPHAASCPTSNLATITKKTATTIYHTLCSYTPRGQL